MSQPHEPSSFADLDHFIKAYEMARKASAHAINRDKILDDVFRRGGVDKSVHRPLDGPYPPGSWACGPTQRYSVEIARSHCEKAREADAVSKPISLKYHDDDPRVAEAMKAVQDQVKKEIGIDLDLQPLPPKKLREDVEGSHNYELAYYHYDYPADAFWLWPLLDPHATGTHGSNFLGYHNDLRTFYARAARAGHAVIKAFWY